MWDHKVIPPQNTTILFIFDHALRTFHRIAHLSNYKYIASLYRNHVLLLTLSLLYSSLRKTSLLKLSLIKNLISVLLDRHMKEPLKTSRISGREIVYEAETGGRKGISFVIGLTPLSFHV